MRGRILTSIFLIYSTNISLADINQCLNISNDLDRLTCYDKVSGHTPVTTNTTIKNSPWVSSTETSKLTDDKNVVIFVESEDPINCRWNRTDKASLVLRCHEKRTLLHINTQCHMTSSEYDSYGDVTYRLDSEKAKTTSMTASTDNRALGLWTGGKSIPVIKQMIGKEKLVVRMVPYGESPITATFNITGLEEAIKPLRTECKW
ncbi:type VI secretion system-associated protein TagO [Pseudochrobactrum saccharolyticum]|uniref:type VI secretion system-associated protein TagO n=1 Tax=Pseudochrobactrum saccharolyticum TaxID=354352 RepID=UPI002776BF55|nr:type VI secretion system-associated protein TagO [Pseudochrobactrum saccharolyticum]MDP8249597.1 hypothetical protein [Pseudochrobactrum saccharolyticum]